MEYDVNEIIPNLWLGNVKSSLNENFLKKYNIQTIITILDDDNNNDIYKNKFNKITILHIPIKNKDMCGKNFIEFYEYTNDFIKKSLSNNKGVLVHCKRGHHRSANIVGAYLIKYYNFDLNKAVEYIHKLRPYALRKETCMSNGLFEYYLYLKKINKCHKKCSVHKNMYLCHCELLSDFSF